MSTSPIRLEALQTFYGENSKDSLLFMKEVTLVGGEADVSIPVFPNCQVEYALFKKATSEASGQDTVVHVTNAAIGATDTCIAMIMVKATNAMLMKPTVQEEPEDHRTVI